MEEDIQLFRLAGETEEISCDHVHGQSIVYWEDIVQVFPGVKHVKKGNVAVKMLRDSNESRIVPFRIKHYPGVVLDIVLSSSDENTSAAEGRNRDNATSGPTEEEVASLQVTQLPADSFSSDDRTFTLSRTCTLPPMCVHSSFKTESRTSLSFKQIMTLAKKTSMESTIEQRLVTPLPSDLPVQVLTFTNTQESFLQVTQEGGQMDRQNEQRVASHKNLDDRALENESLASRVVELTSKNHELLSRNNELTCKSNETAAENKDLLIRVKEMQDEMKRRQIQALHRLVLLQKNVQALLTQTYQLHEYPIPRLFIVLPQDTSSWDPLDLLSNKFRLYFLCECGEHTKSTNSRIPHHIHLARHEGYDITRPKEFFQRYGSHILTILQMLKYGLTVAGVPAPALSHLISSDAVGHVMDSLKSLTKTLEPGVDQVISCIEKVSSDEGQAVIGLSEQMDKKEALESADLRQLESLLKNKDKNRVLGNLYRIVTTEGHAKWVCIDHHRENYHEKAAQSLRETVASLKGTFDENIGNLEVRLLSKIQADQLYQALGKARSVYELKIDLNWDTTQNDLRKLCETLAITNVRVVEINLRKTDGPTSDMLNRNQRYDPILDIMRHPTIQSFAIRGPQNLSKRSSLLSRNYNFSNLRHLDISLSELQDDISGATHLISKAANLSSLVVGTASRGYDNHYYALNAYSTIAKYWSYSIHFKDWDHTIPPPPRGIDRAVATEQCMERLLKLHRESSNSILNVNWLDEPTANNIAKATTYGSTYTELYLERKGRLGDSFINNISSIVSRSKLSEIEIYTREDEGRVRILESIQWKHLRKLDIYLKRGTFETRTMRTLVNGVKKMSEKIELESFVFGADTWATPLTLMEGDLLQDFLSSMVLKDLLLNVVVAFEQILSLCRSTDVSRLEILKLQTDGSDSVKVDAILDGLQHAKKLSNLRLIGANITEEQYSRMKARGITLKNTWSS